MERYKCKFCNGVGTIWITERNGSGIATCIICGGERTVDWVTNIIQREKPNALCLSNCVRRITDEGHVYFIRKSEFVGL